MTASIRWLRRQLAGVVAIVLVAALLLVANLPPVSAADKQAAADRYRFTPMSLALPAASRMQSIRKVNKDYEDIRAWISSVGSAVALNDLDGDGLANDVCLVDTRTDQVVITPAPTGGTSRYTPFELGLAPLPTNDHIAPMGCVPGDYNEDGNLDLLVYYWGRTPVLFLAKAGATRLESARYERVELVPGANSANGVYNGPQWNTNASTVGDFDGDGHQDVFIGNYFPDGPVLDDRVSGGVTMNHSMSHAYNSGGKYIFRFASATSGTTPTARFDRDDDAITGDAKGGWSLASSATDLDGDGLPELYIGNDFGQDRLLYNKSTPGKVRFAEVRGVRSAGDPKSKVVGNDSFKGMGVDFGDFDQDGLYDMFVSNITTSWGIQESNFQFVNTARDTADLSAQLKQGTAPWEDRSAENGTAWSGWGWDVKIADYDNSGEQVITQATGFVKGDTDRWPQLQELAAANDALLSNPFWWPNVKQGDDIAGSQTLHFFARTAGGRYVDLAPDLGLAVPVPTRGIATGDADGDGKLDLVVSRQFDAPVFYRNTSPGTGKYLQLRTADEMTGSPVIGATATVTTADGKVHTGRVDGGSGHSGKRSHEIHIGLGDIGDGPLRVHLQWRDCKGALHRQDIELTPGKHTLQLGAQAKEK